MPTKNNKISIYPDRFPIPLEKISWSIPFPEYQPPYFVADSVLANDRTLNPRGWADPEDLRTFKPRLVSYLGQLSTDKFGRPLNPTGRTGIAGRGLLGAWGANFAADPIVTRINPQTGLLEMIAIQRSDTLNWAIPGGMVDANEDVSQTLAREFQEETGGKLDMSDADLIYQGYVDDPRNTDHAWIETTAKHKHLDPDLALKIRLQAGDDARAVKWLELSPGYLNRLHANHGDFVHLVIRKIIAEQKIELPAPAQMQLRNFN